MEEYNEDVLTPLAVFNAVIANKLRNRNEDRTFTPFHSHPEHSPPDQ